MRFGLVLNVLDEEYQISVYKGIVNQAEKLGIELICFQQENAHITPEDFLTRFPDKDYFNLDGMILLTSVISDNYVFIKKADIEKIWGNLPVVSIGQKIDGIPSVLINTEASMKQLVEHLILDHKYRNLLYISGAQNHPDAISREQVFVKTLKSFMTRYPDIKYVIKNGYFTETTAIEAMTEYLEEYNNEVPDVVVCANDNMAIGVYKFLKMNSNIKECAVTGFDDIPQSRFEIPSLTTVQQPLFEIGAKGVDILKTIIEKKQYTNEYFIDSRVMFRKSCGCRKGMDDVQTNEQLYREMQINYVQSENHLRMVSHFGQDLNYVQGYGGLKYVIRANIETLGLKNFCMLRFSNSGSRNGKLKNIIVDPLYIRRDGSDCYLFENKTKIPLGQFYNEYLALNPDEIPSLIFKYLRVGEDLIGCVLYDTSDIVLPYLSSIALNIAQGLNRIDILEERQRRSEYLEKEVSERTKELVEANEKRMKVEAEVLRISEIERQRFSNDLHDDICQRLAGISMLCRSYSNQNNPVEKDQMLELAQLIGETLQVTRQYAHNSYPVELESLGMNHSLSNLCNSFMASSGVDCDYEWAVREGIHLDKTQKLNIFRIIQEALHNILKHARAKKVNVSVKSEDRKIIVQVIDDGVGFATDTIDTKKGIGLNSMEYRANQIGAKFVIKQNKPSGTIVQITVKI